MSFVLHAHSLIVGLFHLASWIGYEKEGFRGHQYLLEEGEYNDWTQWGGYNEELVSLRLIRTVRKPACLTGQWMGDLLPRGKKNFLA